MSHRSIGSTQYRKKHYTLMSEALRKARPRDISMLDPQYLQWVADCNAVADVFAVSEAFDRQRFLSDCGVV